MTERSIEECAHEILYLSWNTQLWAIIAQTVQRVPPEVQEFVFEKCLFLSVGEIYGTVFRGKDIGSREWVVLLVDDLPEDDDHSIVAHEIAHAYLGHDQIESAGKTGVGERYEIEVTDLVKSWGFTGIGADTEYCTR